MKLKPRLKSTLISSLLVTLCVVNQAGALEYTYGPPDDYLYAQPTSQDVIYEEENINVNRSKTAALMPPGFGTPTSYLPGSGEYLTPNLAPGALSGGLVNSLTGYDYTDANDGAYPGANTSTFPSAIPSADGGSFTVSTVSNIGGSVGFTDVTDNLYYSGGHLGTLQIPAINVNTKIYQGTSDTALAKGAGHFEDTSIWSGNVALAAHNRGVNTIFGQIHTLSPGDAVILTTQLGTRTYEVVSVEKIGVSDTGALGTTRDNRITLFTCVKNESAYRWCVTAVEKAG